jgi:flagellar hook-associated protein 2
MGNNLGIDGLSSGFKTTEVVNKLMAIERKPLNLIEKKKNLINQQSDAWRDMNTRLNALKDAAYALQSVDLFKSRSATVSDNEALTVTSATGAALDKYNITVKQLAKSHSLTSDAKKSSEAALNLKGAFKINGKAIAVEPGDNLKKIAAKINQTADVNVAASVIQVDAGKFKLVLTSKNNGQKSKITFKDGGIGRGVLTNLGVLNRKDKIKNEIQAATDANITLNGVGIQRPSNRIDDAITNVVINLKKENTTAQVTVDLDKDKILAAARTFVEKYNSLMDYINQNNSYAAGTTSSLFGDSTLMNIQTSLQRTLQPQVSGIPSSVSLMSLVGIKGKSGIDGAKSGQLELDETLFNKKLDRNFDDIAKLFGATDENGVFKKMHNVLFEMTGAAGLVDNKMKASGRELSDLNKQLTTAGERLDAKEQAYYKKFNAMEKALSSLKNQSAWMTAQLNTMNNNQQTKEGAF